MAPEDAVPTTPPSPVRLAFGDARAEVRPDLGALVTRFSVEGRELLYLDEASLAGGPGTSRRGGVPVLFPSPGRLKSDLFEIDGRYGSLKNHGFARDLPFAITVQSERAVGMRLEASDETLARFPWDFALDLEVSLEARGLRYALTITNTDAEEMPCAFGLHPYFAVSDKATARATTGATRAFDNRSKKTGDVPPIDFAAGELDVHLIDHPDHHLDLEADGIVVRVSGSDEFKTWVLWTTAEGRFVCVEPWTSPGNALNTQTDLMRLAPGTTRTLWAAIELR